MLTLRSHLIFTFGTPSSVLRRAYAEAPDDPKVRLGLADLLIEQSGVNLYNNSEIALARKHKVDCDDLKQGSQSF